MTAKRARLCYWIARSRLPVTPVISHTPVRSRFYHIHIQYKRNWDGFWLMNLTQKSYTRSYIFFKFAICSIALLSLGETCHLKGRDMATVWWMLLLLSCYDCDRTRKHYDVTRFKYVLWRRTMHAWVMNIHYQTWIGQGRFINMIRTPSKQWGVCDKCMMTMTMITVIAHGRIMKVMLIITDVWEMKQTDLNSTVIVKTFMIEIVDINRIHKLLSIYERFKYGACIQNFYLYSYSVYDTWSLLVTWQSRYVKIFW